MVPPAAGMLSLRFCLFSFSLNSLFGLWFLFVVVYQWQWVDGRGRETSVEKCCFLVETATKAGDGMRLEVLLARG